MAKRETLLEGSRKRFDSEFRIDIAATANARPPYGAVQRHSLQRGRVCARPLASYIPRSSEDQSSWIFFIQVCAAAPAEKLACKNSDDVLVQLSVSGVRC